MLKPEVDLYRRARFHRCRRQNAARSDLVPVGGLRRESLQFGCIYPKLKHYLVDLDVVSWLAWKLLIFWKTRGSKMRRFNFAVLCAPFLAGVLAMTPARASVVYTASGSPVTGINDSAKATFTVGAGTITVTLDELSQYTGQSDVGLLSGISFVVGPAVSSTTLSSYTYAGLASLSSSGTVTSATETATHWGTTVSGGAVYLATVGTGAAGKQPYDLIIGPNSSGDFSSSYGSVNSSVTNHLPVVLGEATFVISAPGVTSATTITNVAFNFGTSSGQTLTGTLVATPEPASMVVLASGLLGMGVFARKKAKGK